MPTDVAMKPTPRAKAALTLYERMGMQTGGLLPEQIYQLLKRTPQKYIYTRPGKGGGTWSFVKVGYVQSVLNYVFAWNWDFRVISEGREGNLVWAKGELEVRLPDGQRIVKQQYGRADIKYIKGTKDPLDYGNDLKAAASDALKKCASHLGIAKDVYNPAEFQEVEEAPEDPNAITASQRVVLNDLIKKTNTEPVPEPKTKEEADHAIASLAQLLSKK